MFYMPYDRFYRASPAEILAGLPLHMLCRIGGRGLWDDYCRASFCVAAPESAVAKNLFRRLSPYGCDLAENSLQRVAIVFVPEALCTDNDTVGLGHGDGGLVAELIFLMVLAFADATDPGLMKAVNLLLVLPLLVNDFPVKFQFFQEDIPPVFREFAGDVPQQGVGYGFQPALRRRDLALLLGIFAEPDDARQLLELTPVAAA